MSLYAYDREAALFCGGIVAGTDEVGRGPLAGPVVAAAVILDLDKPIEGVNDSKKLSAKKRETLYDLILENAAAWCIAECSPAEIDSINILQASLLAMRKAVDGLNHEWKLLLIDGNKTIPYFSIEQQRTVVKGDGTSAAIAAASIIAKVHRDRLMMQLHDAYPVYGFADHMGYPTAVHRAKLIEHGMSPVHRRTFCGNILARTEIDLF